MNKRFEEIRRSEILVVPQAAQRVSPYRRRFSLRYLYRVSDETLQVMHVVGDN